METHNLDGARELLEGDQVLLREIENALNSRNRYLVRLLRALHLFANVTPEPISGIELYMTIFEGALRKSDYLKRVFESIRRMTPDDLVIYTARITAAIENGNPEMDLEGWASDDEEFVEQIQDIEAEASSLARNAVKAGKPIRSSDAIHSKGLRTTVIAQRVQLSYEQSTVTEPEKEFISLVDRISSLLEGYFTLENPKKLFLNEVWLCEATRSSLDVFAPRPRAVIEEALSCPRDYLTCEIVEEGLSSTHPATAILYQSYLEAGSLINMADLWTTFYEITTGSEGEEGSEREALMQFYQSLADLKLLGMVKQSKKKADHLAKVAWNGL